MNYHYDMLLDSRIRPTSGLQQIGQGAYLLGHDATGYADAGATFEIQRQATTKKAISYKPHWTCSRRMEVVLDGDIIKDVQIKGIGCDGNIQGLIAMVERD